MTDLEQRMADLEDKQRRLESRFTDLKSRFDGQGATLAESARWVEGMMDSFEKRLQDTLKKYKDLLQQLSAFDFGVRLETVETEVGLATRRVGEALRQLKVIDAESQDVQRVLNEVADKVFPDQPHLHEFPDGSYRETPKLKGKDE